MYQHRSPKGISSEGEGFQNFVPLWEEYVVVGGMHGGNNVQ